MPLPKHPIGDMFIERFAAYAGVRVGTLRKEVRKYNQDFSKYGNEVYSRLGSRVAHWVNYMEQGWFQHRLDLPLLAASEFDVVVDLGFSVPYGLAVRQLREYGPRFILVDREPSTVEFFRTVVRMNKWQHEASRFEIVLADLCMVSAFRKLAKLLRSSKPRARSVLIVASEVLEHLTNVGPACAWMRAELDATDWQRCAAFVTLPIGDRIPSHVRGFDTRHRARAWLGRAISPHSSFVLQSGSAPRNRYLKSVYCAWHERGSG